MTLLKLENSQIYAIHMLQRSGSANYHKFQGKGTQTLGFTTVNKGAGFFSLNSAGGSVTAFSALMPFPHYFSGPG